MKQKLIMENWRNFLTESHSKEHEAELKKVADELHGASKMHKGQAERIEKILDQTDDSKLEEDCWDGYERVPGSKEGEPGSCRKKTDEGLEALNEDEICKAGKDWVDGKTIGGQLVKRGEDGKFNNWSARAAQIASKYCKDPNYGRGGKDKKNESTLSEEDGGLGNWEKENWTHSDGSPCGDPKDGSDGSQSRCKPASKWKTMDDDEKAADNAKKKAGTKAGKQYVPATKKGKVTKSHTKEMVDRIVADMLLEMQETLDMLDEEEAIEEKKKSAAWQRKAGKNKEGGLNAKGRKSYEKENPGSDLKAPVSAKQAKKSKGGKAAKRRKSFCARMCGMKKKNTGAKGKRDPDSRINKSLRKWDCNC